MDTNQSDIIVRYSFCEQKALNLLQWYITYSWRENTTERATIPISYLSQIRTELEKEFEESRDQERQVNRKLTFFNSIKEAYLTGYPTTPAWLQSELTAVAKNCNYFMCPFVRTIMGLHHFLNENLAVIKLDSLVGLL